MPDKREYGNLPGLLCPDGKQLTDKSTSQAVRGIHFRIAHQNSGATRGPGEEWKTSKNRSVPAEKLLGCGELLCDSMEP